MDQHPMPRQITTFEFKLIGFLTLKQFLYLVVFLPAGFIVFKLVPIPVFNILFALIVGSVGVAFAFVPINERPLEVWIKNFIRRLTSPTQYIYKKNNTPIFFLKNLYFVSDPHRVMSHIESQEKLQVYLANAKSVATTSTALKKQSIDTLLNKSDEILFEQKKTSSNSLQNVVVEKKDVINQGRKPFFSGVIKSHKLIPIPGILIYVKDKKGAVLRLLKTNPHGVFATFNALLPDEYLFEFKDPKSTYFFDTMKLKLEAVNPKSLEFFSKELI